MNGDGDIITRFCDIHHECNLSTSEFKPAKIRVAVRNSQARPVEQKSARSGKMISRASASASAGVAAVCFDALGPMM
jgi:hypothetical protein